MQTPGSASTLGCTVDVAVTAVQGTLVPPLEEWYTEGGIIPDGADKMEDACKGGNVFLRGPSVG